MISQRRCSGALEPLLKANARTPNPGPKPETAIPSALSSVIISVIACLIPNHCIWEIIWCFTVPIKTLQDAHFTTFREL